MKALILRLLAAAVAVAAFFVSSGVQDVRSQGKDPAKDKEKGKAAADARITSISQCIMCHRDCFGDTEAEKEALQELLKNVSDFITLKEPATFFGRDLHANAFKHIDPDQSELAAHMQTVLRQFPERGPNYEIKKAAECLACHSVDLNPSPVTPSLKDAGDRFHTKQGVNCSGCHGVVSKSWVFEHADESWRGVDPKKKFADYGQIDLRDPQVRAEKCASCHVGNKAEGKFVTHDMYAAGHPPLPAFELSAYCRDEPRHYHQPKDNKFLVKLAKDDANAAWERFHFRGENVESSRVRELVVGAVGSFKTSMKLLEEDARTVKEGQVADFAVFDCASCHHDLKYPAERQNRNQGVPGRPLLKLNDVELIRAVLDPMVAEQKMAGDEFATNLRELQKAVGDKPFGDPKDVQKKAENLAKSCDRIAAALNAAAFDAAKTKKIHNELVKALRGMKDQKGPTFLDYDRAQQIAWALIVLREELKVSTEEKDAAALKGVVEVYLRQPPYPNNNDALAVKRDANSRLAVRLNRQYRDYKSDDFFKAIEPFLKEVP